MPSPTRKFGHVMSWPRVSLAGRFSLRFQTPESKRVWGVELEFDRQSEKIVERIFLGSQLPIYSVGNSNRKQATRIQRLQRTTGMHQLTCLFEPESTSWMVDTYVLRTLPRSLGRLTAVSLFAEAAIEKTIETTTETDRILIHDVALHSKQKLPARIPNYERQADTVLHTRAGLLFGDVIASDDNSLTIKVNEQEICLHWSEILEVTLKSAPMKSTPTVGKPLIGILSTIQFSPLADFPQPHPDKVRSGIRCAITGIEKNVLELNHPFLGTWQLPLKFVDAIQPGPTGKMQYLQSEWIHLGNEVQTRFAVPRPSGSQCVLKFFDAEIPEQRVGQTRLRLLVRDLEPASPKTPPGSRHLRELRAGNLLTNLYWNGFRLACLNRLLRFRTRDHAPQEIVISVPNSLLQPGENVLRIIQTSAKGNPHEFDDCEIGRVVLETLYAN